MGQRLLRPQLQFDGHEFFPRRRDCDRLGFAVVSRHHLAHSGLRQGRCRHRADRRGLQYLLHGSVQRDAVRVDRHAAAHQLPAVQKIPCAADGAADVPLIYRIAEIPVVQQVPVARPHFGSDDAAADGDTIARRIRCWCVDVRPRLRLLRVRQCLRCIVLDGTVNRCRGFLCALRRSRCARRCVLRRSHGICNSGCQNIVVIARNDLRIRIYRCGNINFECERSKFAVARSVNIDLCKHITCNGKDLRGNGYCDNISVNVNDISHFICVIHSTCTIRLRETQHNTCRTNIVCACAVPQGSYNVTAVAVILHHLQDGRHNVGGKIKVYRLIDAHSISPLKSFSLRRRTQHFRFRRSLWRCRCRQS